MRNLKRKKRLNRIILFIVLVILFLVVGHFLSAANVEEEVVFRNDSFRAVKSGEEIVEDVHVYSIPGPQSPQRILLQWLDKLNMPRFS